MMLRLGNEGKSFDLAEDVVQFALFDSDFDNFDFVFQVGGVRRVETAGIGWRGRSDVSIFSVGRDEEVLIPHETLAAMNGQNRSQRVRRLAFPPPAPPSTGWLRLGIDSSLLALDVLLHF